MRRGGAFCSAPLRYAPQNAPPRLWFLEGNSNCRSRERIVVAEHTKLVGGYGTTVDHVLAMPFDDPLMDDDLCRVLSAHEIVLDGDWPDIW